MFCPGTITPVKGHGIAIRDMLPDDIASLATIEQACFAEPWGLDQLKNVIAPPIATDIKGCVAVRDATVQGFMVFSWHRRSIELITVAVYPFFQRCHVGAELVGSLLGNLGTETWHRVVARVHECWLPAQLLMRSLGFRCMGQKKRYYDDKADALDFEYRLEGW
jgi:ribosomal-protein-alanine N-acetyltransferase